jgi:NAD(P)-dependent dehydrogenase (short-subunit alcohol dehydrogenase family)
MTPRARPSREWESLSRLLVDEDVESWNRVMEINTRGPWLAMRAMARAVIDAGVSGSLIATSSVSAHLVDRAWASTALRRPH